MLKDVGLSFKKIISNVDEFKIKKNQAEKSFPIIALKIAEEKARVVSSKFPRAFVIGADQVCVFNRKIVNKPGDNSKAIQQLKKLQGKEHCQISAFCLYRNNSLVAKAYDKTVLTMRKLSTERIKKYVETDNPIASCGSYKYEENGYLLFSKVKGSIDTVKGLPLLPLLNILFKEKVISYD